MGDEGFTGSPIPEIEGLEAMRTMARLGRAFYDELLDQGFTPEQAIALLREWIRGASSGNETR